ncbi:hypothetical protein J6590_017184 [Homalodisca vitripennis]|nr:hypothetical protein J6590_017184 [Homalodisca vitripennis]
MIEVATPLENLRAGNGTRRNGFSMKYRREVMSPPEASNDTRYDYCLPGTEIINVATRINKLRADSMNLHFISGRAQGGNEAIRPCFTTHRVLFKKAVPSFVSRKSAI